MKKKIIVTTQEVPKDAEDQEKNGLKDKKEKKNKKVKKKDKPKVIKNCLDIIPIRFYNTELEAFELEDKSYMDIMQVLPRDMQNVSDDEKLMEMAGLMRSYKTIECDIKFLSMTFPLNLNLQKSYLEHHIEFAEDEVAVKWLKRELNELELAEKNINKASYYMIFFGKNDQDFMKNKDDIIKYTSMGSFKFVEEISKYQKVQVLQKLTNMNTLVNLYDIEEEAYE